MKPCEICGKSEIPPGRQKYCLACRKEGTRRKNRANYLARNRRPAKKRENLPTGYWAFFLDNRIGEDTSNERYLSKYVYPILDAVGIEH